MFIWCEQDNPAQAAEALAQAVAAALQTAVAQQDSAVLAVSGGRSPIAFFEALSQIDLAWDKITVALVDERIVPTCHADSNSGLVRRHLLQNKAAAATWLPMVDDAADETQLTPATALAFARSHYRQPDVLVLGMGADGHTASLFPQAPQLAAGIAADCSETLIHTTPVTAPHERISMTLNAIAQTRSVFLAIQGADKKAVFDRAAAGDAAYPIGLVLNHTGVECHVFYTN
ncbi:6-phosphogluconolactonase [Neisseria lisongii]|uniref:6-phosphogluconolactonase n=1 Tax=Neisseria lisongii TaxID=2912188 RepID=A0AAW5ADD2_9NEIS|nr:6-phosphogluconolactonase [Neisseria lisongii]MCF7529319.1 6-phosphogluconolactonase [Neisseria lisongii]